MNKRTFKVGILVDMMGSSDATQEEEIAEHKKRFRRYLAPHKCNFYTMLHAGIGMERGIQDGTDLVVFDFGGMGLGCTDLVLSNCRELIHWAQDNPSRLVVVVSDYTFRHYVASEMREMGLELVNVVLDDHEKDTPIPEWFLAPEGSAK